jgi:hypothetical protein
LHKLRGFVWTRQYSFRNTKFQNPVKKSPPTRWNRTFLLLPCQTQEKELKAFKKVKITPGETVNITLNIPVKDLAYYEVKTGKWVVEPGKYKLLAGASSRDIEQSGMIEVN